jgi:hypothetical protein
MWTAIGLDWKLPAAAIAQRLNTAATDGAILCLHDGRVLAERPNVDATIDAVRQLLPLLHAKHLSITSVSAMLER